jgi:hypothetical protein
MIKVYIASHVYNLSDKNASILVIIQKALNMNGLIIKYLKAKID